MKYMIMLYGSQRDYDEMTSGTGVWKPEHFAALGEFMSDFNQRLVDSGELVDTRGLSAPAHARRIHARDGELVVTDGPYPEAQEVLAGYWLVDCASFDRATEIARRLAETPGPAEMAARAVIDIRPVADSQGDLVE
jgi:hypothetical protein